MKSSTEPAGANCTLGGVKLELGRDRDRDGVLTASEVDAALTRYVCNGAQGPAGGIGMQGPPGESVTSTPLPAGDSHCAFGGVSFTIGTTTTYACSGAPGNQGPQGIQGPQGGQGNPGSAGQSVIVENLALGDQNCPAGGSKFTAANGTGFACNGVDHNTVLNAGAAPLASCAAIMNAGVSRGSGVYRIDTNAGSPSDAFPRVLRHDHTRRRLDPGDEHQPQ